MRDAAPVCVCKYALVRCIALTALSLFLTGAAEFPDLRPSVIPSEPMTNATFTVISREPYAELRFHGVGLRGARPDPRFNEIVLDFTGPAPAGLFEQIGGAIPEWVEYAYAAYDSAVIRGREPVIFSTFPESDGFVLRIEPASGPTDLQLAAEQARLAAARGDVEGARERLVYLESLNPNDPFILRTRAGIEAGVGDWQAAERYYALARAELPWDEGLRGTLEEARRETGTQFSLATEYRDFDQGAVLDGRAMALVPLRGRYAADAEITGTRATGENVQQTDGTTIARVESETLSGAVGVLYRLQGGGHARLGALFSKAGPGAAFSFLDRGFFEETELFTQYHAGFGETTEANANDAFQDQIVLRHARRLFPGVWAEAALRATRYGVDQDDWVAKTAGFQGSLRYIRNFFGWSAGLSYELDGEYVWDEQFYADIFGTPYLPLGIRDREVHALSLSASAPLLRNLWIDAYGGWALDRYGSDGPYGGLTLRYALTPGLDLTAGVSHSAVSGNQGATGSTTTAGINLTYKMQGGLWDAP